MSSAPQASDFVIPEAEPMYPGYLPGNGRPGHAGRHGSPIVTEATLPMVPTPVNAHPARPRPDAVAMYRLRNTAAVRRGVAAPTGALIAFNCVFCKERYEVPGQMFGCAEEGLSAGPGYGTDAKPPHRPFSVPDPGHRSTSSVPDRGSWS